MYDPYRCCLIAEFREILMTRNKTETKNDEITMESLLLEINLKICRDNFLSNVPSRLAEAKLVRLVLC